jgi:hypothetical protein
MLREIKIANNLRLMLMLLKNKIPTSKGRLALFEDNELMQTV